MLKTTSSSPLSAFAFAVPAAAQQAPVQPSPIKRIPLQKIDVPGTNYETVIGMAEIVPMYSSASTATLARSRTTCWKAKWC